MFPCEDASQFTHKRSSYEIESEIRNETDNQRFRELIQELDETLIMEDKEKALKRLSRLAARRWCTAGDVSQEAPQ